MFRIYRGCCHKQAAFSLWIILLSCPGWLLPVNAQEQASVDSLKTYDLSEIVIGGASRQEDRTPRAYRVQLAELSRQDVPDVASTLRLMPSATVQTNSRGETLVYIRAAGERQVAVYLDGAPLNVAWDNRIDLSLVPSTIVGAMSVERGAVGPGYGTNTSGGVLNLFSRHLDADGRVTEATLQTGTAGSQQFGGLHAFRRNGNGILIGGTFARRDGISRPGGASLLYEPSSALRTNTDRQGGNAYVRLDKEGAKGRIGLTVMHASASKGVAPEGHLDPTADRVRYWRYPLWHHSMAILNGVRTMAGPHLAGSIWFSRFRQEIEEYPSIAYQDASSVQKDADNGMGIRLILEGGPGIWRWRLLSVVSAAEHRQVDQEMKPFLRIAPEVRYRNVLHTLGAEVTSGPGFPGHWVMGVAWDGMRTPETGLFPSTGGFDALAVNAEWHRNIGRRSTIKVNGGSKPRFPTMRELFGTSLDSFIVNPALRPERSWILEGGWSHVTDRWQTDVAGFIQRTRDTIDQENVTVDGERKRQRINLDGSRVIGVEWQAAAEVTTNVDLRGHVTWLRPVAITEGAASGHLTEKPELLATLIARFGPFRGVSLDATGIYTGRAFGRAPDNSLVSLPTAWQVNFRLAAQRFFADSGLFLQTYVGADNVFDALLLPQLGLPEAGRALRFGVSLAR